MILKDRVWWESVDKSVSLQASVGPLQLNLPSQGAFSGKIPLLLPPVEGTANLKEFLSSDLLGSSYNLAPYKSKLFTPCCIFTICSQCLCLAWNYDPALFGSWEMLETLRQKSKILGWHTKVEAFLVTVWECNLNDSMIAWHEKACSWLPLHSPEGFISPSSSLPLRHLTSSPSAHQGCPHQDILPPVAKSRQVIESQNHYCWK